MADKEVWNLGGPIAAPAATDRVPLSTAALAGGYSLRGDFVWKDAAGKYRMAGDLYASRSEVPRLQLERAGVLNWFVGGSGVGGDNSFLIQLNANPPAFIAQSSGNNGTGTATPQTKWHVKSFGEVMRLETTTARGSGNCFQGWYDPTGSKGYFGFASAFNDQLYLMNALNADMLFGTNNVDRWRVAAAGPLTPVADNAYAFGGASNRPTVLWAASGTISTSDEREKKWRGPLSKAELLAGTRCLEELGFYQWLDAIAAKRGKGQARFHFGARAQRVWGIFADAGLVDPIGPKGPGKAPYAFLCYDKWAAEAAGPKPKKGSAAPRRAAVKVGDRYGLRVDQFALFLVAVIDAQRKADAARIDALEAALAALQAAA